MANISEHEAKMLGLQYQIRENQQDLGDFLKDLDNWENDIKEKDGQLKKHKPINEPTLPPVRNSLHKKKKKRKKKSTKGEEETNTSPAKPKRISGYDFKSWDKFDVEKACEEINSESNQSSLSEETDEEWELERKKQQAILEKDNGNDYLKKGEYCHAIESYTLGIQLDPTNPLLSANRALALLKEKKFGAAEDDCDKALSLDPLYIKAYLRRAAARCGLAKYDDAKCDYKKVLQLEPQNKQAALELQKIEKEEARAKLVSHCDSVRSSDVGVVRPITKPPGERSKKPLRRLVIEEIGVDGDEPRQAAISKVVESQSGAKKAITKKDEKLFEKFVSTKTDDRLSAKSESKMKPDSNTNTGKGSSSGLPEKNASESTGRQRLGCTTDVRVSETQSSRIPSVPETSYQFQADYKVLKNNLELFYTYFKRIPPECYLKLFGEALESEILMNVLKIYKEFYIPSGEDYCQHLLHLAHVKRFSMMVMFLSSKEKQVVCELHKHLVLRGDVCEKDLKTIANKYEVKS